MHVAFESIQCCNNINAEKSQEKTFACKNNFCDNFVIEYFYYVTEAPKTLNNPINYLKQATVQSVYPTNI